MTEVTKGEILVSIPTAVVFALPLLALYRANKKLGIKKVRHFINRYTLWLVAEVLALVALTHILRWFDSDVAWPLVFLLYIVFIFAVFPFYGVLLMNVVYLLVFIVGRRYRHQGWDWREMTIGRGKRSLFQANQDS